MGNDKNRFNYTGTLTRVDRFTTKNNKTILTLVFEEGGQWPQWIAIKCFGRLTECASDWKPGTILEVTGKLGGREYQGKVYSEVIADSVEVVAESKPKAGAQQTEFGDGSPAPSDDDIPF